MAKTVLITGASSGFGKEAARLFHQQGWNVVATMRSPEKETDLTGSDNLLLTRLDVQDASSIAAAIAAGVERFGGLDALVNSAGYGLMGVFEASSPAQIRRQYEVNVFGLMDVTRAALPHLRASGAGVVINLSSVGGLVGLPFGSPYNSTKFAVEGFSEALSHELAPFGVAVKLVEPGSVATNFRSGIEMIENTIPDYAPKLANFVARYGASTAHLPKATAAEVAAAIFEAATDGLPRLRYLVGADTAYYAEAKHTRSEADYVQFVRTIFFD